MEVPVDNFYSAQSAREGGATRLELCSALSEGGLTPTVGFLKKCKKEFQTIGMYCMIRCRGNDFIYNDEELEIMTDDIKILKENGADGFVFGLLNSDKMIDEHKCQILLDLAKPKPCTFHRAFDEVKDYSTALNSLINLGFTRVLTSGQNNTAMKGIDILKDLVNQAGDRIIILPGGGVTYDNAEEILRVTNAKEIHASCREKFIIAGETRFMTKKEHVAQIVDIYRKMCV